MKKYHETIFDRFNQVVDEQRENKGGSGLGLTITKHINRSAQWKYIRRK